ncbi:hypothetical protein [Salinigranum halophilum]|uniref:hypothetical protein n=1 Tax=Salinigranum halophilum TaxID=2565931 RepID=UPI0010A7F4F1|nr:hypothetical protein [Salinigranum halophilum]
MQLERPHLMVLLNALYDLDQTSISVAHPSDDIGTLLEIRLKDGDTAEIIFPIDVDEYRDARDDIRLQYGDTPYNDLPDRSTLVRALTASQVLEFENQSAIESTLGRVCYPAVEAGESPVMLGLDANIFPWGCPDVLDIDHETGNTDDKDRRPSNGYALSSGVVDELHWRYSHWDPEPLVEAFGEEFRRLEGQPGGSRREGRLGLQKYQTLVGTRNVDFVDSEIGDDEIINGYVRYSKNRRKKPFLLSNDYGFIETATDEGIAAQHLKFQSMLPGRVTASWDVVANALYYLSLLFGVLILPKATLYGVWSGKEDASWQKEKIDIDCRGSGSNLQTMLARQRRIAQEFERIAK